MSLPEVVEGRSSGGGPAGESRGNPISSAREGQPPLLSVQDVSHIYPGGRAPVVALNGVSLEVYAGEIVAVLGRSGSGKTTLLNVAATIEDLQSGKVFIDGRAVSDMTAHDLAVLRRRSIGTVFQRYNLLPSMTASQNICLPLELDGVSRRRAREMADRMLEALGIEELGNRYPEQISGGEQQRVAIGRALIGTRRLVFADEPTGALDSTSAAAVMSLLRQQATELGIGVLLVTHDRDNLEYADTVVKLNDGAIVEHSRGQHRGNRWAHV